MAPPWSRAVVVAALLTGCDLTQAGQPQRTPPPSEGLASAPKPPTSPSRPHSAALGTCSGRKVVRFVQFVEPDAKVDPTEIQAMDRWATAFQQYWFDQFGATFLLASPAVTTIRADHPSQWYLDTPDGIHADPKWYRLGNVKNEVYRKLELADFDPRFRLVVYPSTRHDGLVGGNFGAVFMDGDDLDCALTPETHTYPFGPEHPAECMGHLAHEWGHTFGLDHRGAQDECMQRGFYTAWGGGRACRFAPPEVLAVLTDPENRGWLDYRPGDTCAL